MYLLALHTCSIVAIEITGETKDLAAALQKSEKHAETLEAKLKGAGKAGSNAFKHMASEAGSFALGLAGVGSVESVFEKVVELAKHSIEEMRKLQRDALGEQVGFSDALGAFLDKNKTLGQDQVKTWTEFAEKQGATGVRGGAEGVLTAASGLRAGAPGSAPEQQREALARAVQNKLLNPETDLAAFAMAVLKLMDSQKMNLTQAANVVSIAAAQSGGNVAGLAESVGKLSAVAGLSHGDTAGALALQSLLTPTMGDSSEKIAGQLLARGATRDVKIRGRKLALKSEGGIERVTEALDRIDAGEFGDSTKALGEYSKALGLKGTEGLVALDVVRKNRARLDDLNRQFTSGMAPGVDLVAQGLATKAAVMPASQDVAAMREAKAKAEEESHGRTSAAALAAADMSLEEFDKQFGIVDTFDVGRGARRTYADAFTGAKPFEAAEKMRRARGAVVTRWGGAPIGQMSAFMAEGYDALQGAKTPEEVYRVGVHYGAVDTSTSLSAAELKMLQSAGASPEKLAELQQQWTEGLKDAFKAGLSELLMELRQNKTTTRQEVD